MYFIKDTDNISIDFLWAVTIIMFFTNDECYATVQNVQNNVSIKEMLVVSNEKGI